MTSQGQEEHMAQTGITGFDVLHAALLPVSREIFKFKEFELNFRGMLGGVDRDRSVHMSQHASRPTNHDE